MGERDAALDTGSLLGAMIAGVFGLGWAEWGASGLNGMTSVTVRAAGIVLGLVVIGWSIGLRRSVVRRGGSAMPSSSMFASRAYLRTLIGEGIALGIGCALLGGTGNADYIIAWCAIVVGVHFLVFGRLFWSGFYWLGATLIVAGAAGAVVGVAGGGQDAIDVVSGLLTAISLFAAGGRALVLVQAGTRRQAAG
jgi:hypothetical protein